jgi:hypothetical protein
MMTKSLKTCALFALILTALPAFAAPSLSWRDLFDDNRGAWLVGETDDYKNEIADGLYRITGKKAGRSISHSLAIHRESDYSLEARIRSDGSDPSSYLGLIWDFKDWDNYYLFAVSQKSTFAVFRIEAGKTNALVKWKFDAAIKGKDAFNVLKARKSGLKLTFSINGTDVVNLPYMSYSGTKIGIEFSNAQTIAVDSIALCEERRPAGEAVSLPPGAETRFSSSFGKDSAPWLESKGGSTSGTPSGGWDAGDGKDPGYTIEHKDRSYLNVVAKKLDFDLARNFAVEARIRWLSGDESYGYGLVLDRNGDDFLSFQISGDGSYRIDRYLSDKADHIVPWTSSPNLTCYEGTNLLGVYRRNDRLIFAINGREVHEMDYDGWASTEVGFGLGGIMKVRPVSLGAYNDPIIEGPEYGSCVAGFGSWVYKDGSRHVGFWAGGRPDGAGVRYSKDGSITEGIWEKGRLVRIGKVEEALFYPVARKSGEIGLVDASGAESGFGLKSVVSLCEPEGWNKPSAEGGRIGFVDGAAVGHYSPDWTLLSGFSGGYAVVADAAGATGLIDGSGKIVVEPGKLRISKSAKPCFGVFKIEEKKGGSLLYGLAVADGSVIRKPDLLYLSDFSGGLAAAKSRNGRFGFVDLSGSWRIGPAFKRVASFSEGFAYAVSEYRGALEYEEFIDNRGDLAFDADTWVPEERSVNWPFQVGEGLAAFMDEDEEVGFLDTAGEVAIQPGWEDALPFSNGLAAAKLGGLWGYIDRQGAWAIAPTFAEAYSFRPEGLAQVKTTEGFSTWTDRTGRLIWTDGIPLSLVWKENFDDNARRWAVGESQNARATIEKGAYRMTSKTPGGDLEALVLPIDRGSDYLLSAQLRYDSQSLKEAMGLAWDIKDGANSYTFVVSPQGQFAIIRVKDDVPSFLVNWTAHSAIKKGQADNLLEVRKVGQKLEFYVNGSMVKSLPYETCSGQWIGFACYGATTLAVDSLSLKQAAAK